MLRRMERNDAGGRQGQVCTCNGGLYGNARFLNSTSARTFQVVEMKIMLGSFSNAVRRSIQKHAGHDGLRIHAAYLIAVARP
jgi:hypothetical protein